MASLRERDGTYYIVWYDPQRKGNREMSLGKVGLREAKKRKSKFEVEQQNARRGDYTAFPLDTLWDAYLELVKGKKKPGTLKSKKEAWAVFRDLIPAGTLNDVTPAMVLDAAETRATTVAKATVNKWLREMKSIVNEMAALRDSWGKPLYQGDNPFVGVKQYKIPKQRVRAATDVERETLLAEAQKMMDEDETLVDLYLILNLGFWTGMRYGEIDNADWAWFDWDQKLVTIVSSDDWETKKGKARTVPLRDELIEALAPYKQESGFVITGARKRGNRPRKPEVSGYRYHPRTIWATLLKRAGIENFTLHNLRDSFATYFLKKGVDVATVAKWLGHDDVKVTYEHYFDCIGYDGRVNV